MSSSNVILLPSTQGVVSITGTPVRGAGSTRTVGSLYTVVITANNLQGRVYIEGSIASSPTPDDWFTIVMPGLNSPFVEFPYEEGNTSGGTTTAGFNFKGNFTWIRARLDRDYLGLDDLSDMELAPYGFVDNITLNVGGWSAITALSNDTTCGSVLSGVESIKGNNLGNGKRVFANTVGQSNVLMNFRTLIAGPGINLSSNASTITIESRAGDDGINRFVDLLDVPTDVVANAVLFGTNSNTLQYTPPANTTSNATMIFQNGGFVWKDFYHEISNTAVSWNLAVQNSGANVTTAAKTINFTGDVSVVANGSTTTVTVGDAGSRFEWVELQYSTASGMFDGGSVIATSGGVSINITDDVACLAEFSFTNRPYPPTSIAIIGQRIGTSPAPTTFSYQNIHPAMGVQIGMNNLSSLMGNFTGPISMSLGMSDTNSIAPLGQRAKVVVMFGF